MTYNRGTLKEFNTWHDTVKATEGLPKVGYVNSVPAPQNQKTVAYSAPVQNPNGLDDYYWSCGRYPIDGKIILTKTDIKNLNWFAEE